ncbi:MAG TPA: hypothetical protein VIW29_04615 [Polyangiaceae bacterium]
MAQSLCEQRSAERMKGWAVAAALLALGSAVVGIGLATRSATSHEGLAATLEPAPRASAPSAVPAAPSAAATPSAVAAAPSAASVSLESLPTLPRFKKTATYNGAPVYVPEGCQGRYDVILHFHGAHPYVRDLVEKAGIHAVVAVLNAGNGAERYAQAYRATGALSSLLRQVEMAAAPWCAGQAEPGRVALTAWSAGYGGIEKLLARPEDRERVDAVLLADGLHAGFTDRWKRTFAPNALEAFRQFGALAKADHKLFAITHSSIETDGYASTTECSELLLKALSIQPEGPFTSGKSGHFSVEGSTGSDAPAHIAQFRQMDATLLSKLHMRWLD